MSIDWAVLFLGILVLLIFLIGFLIAYAPFAAQRVGDKGDASARLSLWICRVLGLFSSEDDTDQPQDQQGNE